MITPRRLPPLASTLTLFLAAATFARAADSPLTTAATGEPIYSPLAKRTSVLTVVDQTITVPAGMVYIPAGPFTAGTGATAKSVTLDAYCIGKFEVTNAEYHAFLAAHPTRRAPRYWSDGTFPAGKANHPVLFVSLDDALAYCAWITRSTGRRAAIPTAAQWEKAARGPRATLYPWGNTLDTTYDPATAQLTAKFNYNAVIAAQLLHPHATEPATYTHEKSSHRGETTTVAKIAAYTTDGRITPFAVSAHGTVTGWVNHDTYTGLIYTDTYQKLMYTGGATTPIGLFPAGVSAYGCHDMAGNAFEWTSTVITAATGAERGKSVNEVRGGSWYSTGTSAKSTGIGEGRAASGAYHSVGFRIVELLP